MILHWLHWLQWLHWVRQRTGSAHVIEDLSH
jgi:hypothetical protein